MRDKVEQYEMGGDMLSEVYNLRKASEYFKETGRQRDVVSICSVVRPLYDDCPSIERKAARDHVSRLAGGASTPLPNVHGGKPGANGYLTEVVQKNRDHYWR